MDETQKTNLFAFHKLSKHDILVTYKGPFDKHIIAIFGKRLKALADKNPDARRKIFATFIELSQNVAFYSAERCLRDGKDLGVGTLVIGESDEHYIFATGNMIRNEHLEIIKIKCDLINSYNRDNLREYKRQQRNLLPGTNGGAHIGLVMVSLLTNMPLDVDFRTIDDKYTFFTIRVEVSKD